MAILHSFEENKLEYEDEDEVEINMMGTGMDKESLEHNLHENDITSIICHNFSPTSNPPIKLKDSERGDGITGIMRCHHDLSSDGVKKLTTASGRNRLIPYLEDSIL
ncbi:hypothetical protein Tco_0881270 [Tanacetum coccineum]